VVLSLGAAHMGVGVGEGDGHVGGQGELGLAALSVPWSEVKD
jgi:hypothetical protein